MSETSTHWEGCWREAGHHECAIAEVNLTRAHVDALRVESTALRDTVQGLERHVDELEALAKIGADHPRVASNLLDQIEDGHKRAEAWKAAAVAMEQYSFARALNFGDVQKQHDEAYDLIVAASAFDPAEPEDQP